MSDPQPKELRVALYARVSGEEQRQGQNIDSQIAELERFADGKGWRIVDTYKDDGWGGALLSRPALDRLRDDALKNIFDAVLINEVDRLARDVTHLGIMKRDFEKKRIKLIFRKLPNENNPSYNLMVNILGSFAEYEREQILDRMRRGKRHKVEVRKQYMGCIAPYGYNYEVGSAKGLGEAKFEIVPEQAEVVKQIYSWALTGLSVIKIAQRLDSLGIPTRTRRPHWAGSIVHRILHNETYAGVWSYNKLEACEPMRHRTKQAYRRTMRTSRRIRPKKEWLRVNLPERLRIVDPQIWAAVQDRISRNQTFSPRNSKTFYLLRGLLRCGYCGGSCAGNTCNSRHYYRCWKKQTCKEARNIPAPELEALLWSELQSALLNPKDLTTRIKEAQTELSHQAADNMQVETAAIDFREESLLLDQYRSGKISSLELAKRLDMLKRRGEERSQQTHVQAGQQDIEVPVEQIYRRLAEHLHECKPSLRQAILREVIEEVVVFVGVIKVRAKIVLNRDSQSTASIGHILAKYSRNTLSAVECGIASSQINSYGRNPTLEFEFVSRLPAPSANSSASLKQRYQDSILALAS